ncbi:hypothetical protein BT96DRAFT_997537 [Gymnopus androsaceus JB14]|uniref:Uncharacterized protein n=1 Tax=Gymnopus androsaceus JB14 TaxID=1447944 RepID=A0A6A4HEU8_9AGAR|nr:hypothetical protein BT96DRAFT_997537 [Gymnopus androsaceus JB14]
MSAVFRTAQNLKDVTATDELMLGNFTAVEVVAELETLREKVDKSMKQLDTTSKELSDTKEELVRQIAALIHGDEVMNND